MTRFIKVGSYSIDENYVDPNRLKVRADDDAISSELLDLVRVLGSSNFNFFISHGTCLGLVRDGGLIPWDEDADIGIISKGDRAIEFDLLIKTFVNSSYKVTKYHQNKASICVTKSGFIFDISIYKPIGSLLVSSFHYDFITFKHLVGTTSHINWNGVDIPIPQFSHKYLRSLYGLNWKQPDKYNFSFGRRYFHSFKKCWNLFLFGILPCIYS